MTSTKNNVFLDIVHLSIILYPILSIYGFGIPGWTIASALNLIIALFTLLRFRVPRDLEIMPKWLYFLFFDSFVIYFLSSPKSILPLSEIQTLLTFLVVFYYVRLSNIGRFVSLYKKVAIVCIALFFIQFIGFHLFNVRISGVFSFLPIEMYANNSEWLSIHNASDRFCSFFSEPAHFTLFLIPLICIEICKNRKNWLFIALLVLCTLISTSGTGMLVLAIIVIMWYFSGINIREKGNVPKMIALAILMIVAVGVFLRTEVASSYLERETELSLEYEGGSKSGFMRLWRGYYVYAELPTNKKIIGLNNHDILEKYEANSLFANTFRAENDRFYNGMSMLLIEQGLIGLILFVLLIIEIWRKADRAGHLILVAFFTYMLMESVYLNYRMAFYLVLAWCLVKDKYIVSIVRQ